MSSHQRRRSVSVSLLVRVALVAVGIALCRADTPAQSPAAYQVMGLGTFGGSSGEVFDVNEFGSAIVGQMQTATGANHAFLLGYGHALPKDLGTLGGAESTAFAFGWTAIAGSSQTAS